MPWKEMVESDKPPLKPPKGAEVRKQLVTFLLAAGSAMGSFGGMQPASADCTVDLGTSCTGGNCTVNVEANCDGGDCTVNALGSCNSGGTCTVNIGTCNTTGDCTINGGDCINGDTALICLNTVCDGGQPGGKGYTGFTCGFTSDNDDTGVINNDPKKQIGEVDGGPWVVDPDPADPAGNQVTSVTITCTIQVNNPNQGGGGVSRTSTTSGNVGVLADTISYFAQPTDSIYLCSVISWTSTGKAPETVTSDADNDSSNGYQCDLAISTE
jgi:hypothetical protein